MKLNADCSWLTVNLLEFLLHKFFCLIYLFLKLDIGIGLSVIGVQYRYRVQISVSVSGIGSIQYRHISNGWQWQVATAMYVIRRNKLLRAMSLYLLARDAQNTKKVKTQNQDQNLTPKLKTFKK
jgi:hypothetical protein